MSAIYARKHAPKKVILDLSNVTYVDAVLNIRVNLDDIKNIKNFARKFGIGYQTLIAELIHKAAKNL